MNPKNRKYFTSRQVWQKRATWFAMGFISASLLYASIKPEETATVSKIAIVERATQQLRKAGIDTLEVKEGLWGPCLYDPTMEAQQGKCYKTWQLAVNAAIAGDRPTEVTKNGKTKTVIFREED